MAIKDILPAASANQGIQLYFFLTLQPLGHLGDFILVVAHTIFILCEIDVETFCLLGIVVVSGAE